MKLLRTLAFVSLLSVTAPACAPTRELALRATNGVPDPVDCRPLVQRCAGSLPVVCSPVPVPGSDRHREWPTLPRTARGVQRLCTHGCEVTDAGVARCAAAADGGAQ